MRKGSKFVVILLCTAFLTACGTNSVKNTESNETATSSDTTASLITMDMATYKEDDYYTDWKNETPNYIELKGASASLNGSGAEIKDSRITITKSGVYAISGKLDKGQIIVDLQGGGEVKLVLNGAQINCTDSAPIYIKSAEKAIISLEDGTSNILNDGKNYVLDDAASDEPSGAIFSKADLTINGKGTLVVNGSYKDGIVSKDELRITGGNIQIHSTDDGLIGRDMVLVKEGSITIEAGGDGIKSTNDTDNTKGFIALQGGTFKITAAADGIQAETAVLAADGNYNILTAGGSVNGSVKSGGGNGPWGKESSSANTQSSETEEQSSKGIKAALDISISGGTFIIDSADDAIHSNNSVTTSGGDISITSGDDGIHGDSSITINKGKINITKSYEGIESAVVSVIDGEVHVTAMDDGINVAGGNDGSSVNGRPGQNEFSASGNNKLNINGGYIAVNSSGDGLDSNGSIYMTGGRVIVSGPTNDGNGALDYNGTFDISGGVLVAAGSSGMAQAPSQESAQSSIIMYYPSMQQAGSLVALVDGSGSTVAAFKPEKEYQAVVISSPELKKDASYTLYSGGTAAGTLSGGIYTGGSYQGGTKVVEFKISNSVTYLDETGITTQKSFGPGGGNKPGFGGGGNRPAKGKP